MKNWKIKKYGGLLGLVMVWIAGTKAMDFETNPLDSGVKSRGTPTHIRQINVAKKFLEMRELKKVTQEDAEYCNNSSFGWREKDWEGYVGLRNKGVRLEHIDTNRMCEDLQRMKLKRNSETGDEEEEPFGLAKRNRQDESSEPLNRPKNHPQGLPNEPPDPLWSGR